MKSNSEMALSSPKLRYGVVGVGMMGIEHIRNILCLDNVIISCIADNYPKSIETCLALLNTEQPAMAESIQAFNSCENLFKANLCDIVVIATPNHTHYEVLMSAFNLASDTMHILVEKPLCTTIEDCRKVLDVAANRKGRTFVGLEYCYMPPITRVISDVKNNVIGPIHMVSIREHRFPFLVKVRNWNRLTRNSGGTFVEKCCHFFDLFNRILWQHAPVSVFASGAQDVNHLDEVYDGERSDIIDNGYVVINYSGGKRACLDLCMFAEASRHQEEVVCVGAKGKLEAFLPQLEVRTGIRGKDKCPDVDTETVDDDRIKYRGHHYGSSFLEHLDIAEQISTTGTNSTDSAGLYQGLLSVAMGIAAQKSIAENRVVHMNELLTEEDIRSFVR